MQTLVMLLSPLFLIAVGGLFAAYVSIQIKPARECLRIGRNENTFGAAVTTIAIVNLVGAPAVFLPLVWTVRRLVAYGFA